MVLELFSEMKRIDYPRSMSSGLSAVSAVASASLGFFLPSMTTMTRRLLTEKRKEREKGGGENDILVSNNPSALDVAAMNETIDGE